MSTRPAGRALALIRGRLTFANVTALIALFVALAGTSYAALRVGSAQIVDNSVRSKELRNNDVRGRDIHKGTVRGTDVRDNDLKGRDVRDDTIGGRDVKESSLGLVPSAQSAVNAQLALDAQRLAGKSASDFLGSQAQQLSGLIELTVGEGGQVAENGPFTWEADCSQDPGGDRRLTVTLETTEAGSFAGDFGGGGQPVGPGTPVEVFNQSSPSPVYTIGFPLSAIAPSGAAPLGLGFVGIGVLGADCVVNGVLWQ